MFVGIFFFFIFFFFFSVLDKKKSYEIKLKSGCVTICKGNVKLKGVGIDDMYVLNNNIYNKDSVCYYSVVLKFFLFMTSSIRTYK